MATVPQMAVAIYGLKRTAMEGDKEFGAETRQFVVRHTEKEMCVFCAASPKVISAIAYLKVRNAEGQSEVGFILGKAKLAPKPDLTIVRLELCATVLVVEIADIILEELDFEVDDIKFFSDGKKI